MTRAVVEPSSQRVVTQALANRSGAQRRERLGRARVQLLFTPELCGASSEQCGDQAAERALAQLQATLAHVDVVQVRPKALATALERGSGSASAGPSFARHVCDWTRAVLRAVRDAQLGEHAPLVLVNDRVDVAQLLAPEGCDGVHIGQDDLPAVAARARLGPEALIGLSTHTMSEVARSDDLPVDYLGFGPTFATPTKGYAQGLGPEAVWIANQAAGVPLFAIGGIQLENANQLAEVGRVAVSSAILSLGDPESSARAARDLQALLQ